MYQVLANNSITATAKLTNTESVGVDITTAKLTIIYPNSTEVEFVENAGSYIEFRAISSTEVGYTFTPSLKGVYKFTWVITGSSSTATKSINLLVQ